MGRISRHLKQKATYWVLTGGGGFAGYTYATPVVINVRWEVKQELFRDAAGEEVLSKAIIFTEQDVTVGDYLALGELDTVLDPTTLPGETFRIRAFEKVTDLQNVGVVRKVMV